MEDRAHVTPFKPDSSLKYAMYCVFDGHNGAQVASLVQRSLPGFVVRSAAWQEGQTRKALTDAFLEAEATVLADRSLDECGTVATVAVIRVRTDRIVLLLVALLFAR